MRLLLFIGCIGLLPLLSGCALSCRFGPYQNELREAEGNIDRIEGNLARGYALHESSEFEREPYEVQERQCITATADGCLKYETRTVTKYRDVLDFKETPVAIDVEIERSNLEYWYDIYEQVEPLAAAEYDECIATRR